VSEGRRLLHPVFGSAVLLVLYPLALAITSLAVQALGVEAQRTDAAGQSTILAPLMVLRWLIVIVGCLTIGTWLSGIDRRRLGLGRPLQWRWLGAGLVDGLLLVLIPALLALSLGGYALLGAEPTARIAVATGPAALPLIAPICLAIGVAAFGEELLCRGLLLRYWQPVVGTRGAIVLSTVLFTALHGFNSNVSTLGLLGIFLAGLLLAAVYVGSSSLLLVTGLHAGWNLCIGVLLGLPISGFYLPALSRWEVTSPTATLLLGGEFGPEEGPAYQVFLLAVALAVMWRRRRASR
jgi:membrane protease YdiL (CAAX protease family)